MKITVFLIYCLVSEFIWADEFSSVVQNINTELVADSYKLNADIDFKLSPIAKKALQKGISLTWNIIIKVKKEGVLWDSTLQQTELSYQIQNHALLNLYSVKNLTSGEIERFSTLAGALDFISKIRGLTLIDKRLIEADQGYYVGIKVNFKHEVLPVPIRPFSYFDSQWALSSRWMIRSLVD